MILNEEDIKAAKYLLTHSGGSNTYLLRECKLSEDKIKILKPAMSAAYKILPESKDDIVTIEISSRYRGGVVNRVYQVTISLGEFEHMSTIGKKMIEEKNKVDVPKQKGP